MPRDFVGGSAYDGCMDPEAVALCDAMNCLPGVWTASSCCGHGREPFRVFFDIDPRDDPRLEGLFFLVRCTERRYWKYGHLWNISLGVGDIVRNDGSLPMSFMLQSTDKGEEAYAQAQSLVENMRYHLNHEAFCKIIDVDKIDHIVS